MKRKSDIVIVDEILREHHCLNCRSHYDYFSITEKILRAIKRRYRFIARGEVTTASTRLERARLRECARNHANSERVIRWIAGKAPWGDGSAREASIDFNEGPERRIAHAVERDRARRTSK